MASYQGWTEISNRRKSNLSDKESETYIGSTVIGATETQC